MKNRVRPRRGSAAASPAGQTEQGKNLERGKTPSVSTRQDSPAAPRPQHPRNGSGTTSHVRTRGPAPLVQLQAHLGSKAELIPYAQAAGAHSASFLGKKRGIFFPFFPFFAFSQKQGCILISLHLQAAEWKRDPSSNLYHLFLIFRAARSH